VKALDQKALHAAIAGLLDVEPGPGLRRTIFNVVVLNALLYATFQVEPLPGFVAMAVVTGLFYSSVMMTSHDAIHHTLTGWAWFDEVLPRVLSYFVFWPHGVYSELHKQHHRLNGRDLADPERPTPSREEYERAGKFGRWRLRNRWWLALFVYGGFGMILRHALEGLRQARTDKRMRRLVLIDIAGIAAAASVTIAVIVYAGVTWRYALYLLVVERVIGFFQQLRSHLEHYGLHGAQGTIVETRLYNCRNVMTSKLGSQFFNGLNYHSVHHAFPRVPFYHLAEAHARVARVCEDAGRPLPTGKGYARTVAELALSSRSGQVNVVSCTVMSRSSRRLWAGPGHAEPP
jgi:fatty acid desaturase